MKHTVFALLLLMGFGFQQPLSAQKKIKDPIARFAATITPTELQGHELFLADSLLEGRETGQRGQRMAALYVASQFRKAGLVGSGKKSAVGDKIAEKLPVRAIESYFQSFFLAHSEVKRLNITLGEREYAYKKDYFVFGGNGLPEILTGDWHMVDWGKSERVLGKIVFVQGNYPSLPTALGDKIESIFEYIHTLQDAGAKAAFITLQAADFAQIKPFGKGEVTYVTDGTNTAFPVVFVSQAMATDIRVGLQTPETWKWTYSAEVKRELNPTMNVLGFLEGSENPSEIVVVSAHHDHIGITKAGLNHGADDDGSGTAALLEIADAFGQAAAQGFRPKRSILFLSFCGEEKGLLGSEYYTDHPIYPLAQTLTDINIDMIGRTDDLHMDKPDAKTYLHVVGADKISSDLNALNISTNAKYGGFTFDYTYNDEDHPMHIYRRSDHYNFAKNNIPVIFYFSGLHKDYHKPTDTSDKLEYDRMTRTAQFIFAVIWNISNRSERLKVGK